LARGWMQVEQMGRAMCCRSDGYEVKHGMDKH